MKHILLSFLLLVTIAGFGQIKLFSSSNMGTSFLAAPSITIWQNDSISISGDTTAAIRTLFKYAQQMNERYWAQRTVLDHINLDFLNRWWKDKSFARVLSYYRGVEKKYEPKKERSKR